MKTAMIKNVNVRQPKVEAMLRREIHLAEPMEDALL